MRNLFLTSIPTHICSGQYFGQLEIEEIHRLYRLVKKRELECKIKFSKVSKENKMVGLDHHRLSRVLSILYHIRFYNALIRRLMISPSFSPEKNCNICDSELRFSIRLVIKRSETQLKDFKQRFLDIAYSKILHL